ncbi:MAG: outer membrane beta-barrel protein [Phycisphaerae bacterium]|nr:outer membrane beta-barrel protein [Gemmatimonadaceae bacterium]
MGRIVGRIIDGKSGQQLSNATVTVVGTTIGTMSGLEGRFSLANVPAGTVTINVRYIGYEAKTVTGLILAAGGVLEQDVTLSQTTLELSSVVVTATAERGSVNKALDEQRTSSSIVNSTTAEQIQKSPDSDAGQALKRVSGVTLQDGKYPQVRGLGERYTQTSLNGARVPSPDPERKLVPLDMFPSGLLDAITTSKTFTPDQPGDFAGALVDIRTRDFPGRKVFGLSLGSGANGSATGRTILSAPTIGQEWLGFAGSARSLPSGLRNAGNLRTVQPGAQTNALLRSMRNSWSPNASSGAPNGSVGLSYGGEDRVLGTRLGYVTSLSYSLSQEVRDDEVLNVPQADGSGGAKALNSFTGQTGRSSTLWGGLLNFSAWLGSSSRVTLANTYNRTSDNEAQQLSGNSEEYSTRVTTSRLSFIQRSVLSNQLRGDHVFGSRHNIAWTATRSEVSRDEPDRADLNYWQQSGGLQWKGGANDATRTFSTLNERDLAGALNYKVQLGSAGAMDRVFKMGGFTRQLERTSDVRSYDIVNLKLDVTELALLPNQLFDGRYTAGADTNFLIRPSTFGGQYTASERLNAGYAMIELPIGEHVKLITGARVEQAKIEVRSTTAQGLDTLTRLNNTDVLPSLAVTVAISEQQNIRFSASQTLSRPEYRELSPVAYLAIGGSNEERGNPGLKRALVQNYDVRWEMYPNNGEVLSLGVFAKRFDRPIERVFQATTGKPQIGFTNAVSATNFGVELDVRKNLGFLTESLFPLSVFSNVTLMRSRIEVGDNLTAATNPNRAMVGQAPYVVNAGVTYANNSGSLNASLLYNVVGRRITIAGVQPLPDTYEQKRNVVDFALLFPVLRGVSGRLTAQNLLDARYVESTGDLVRRAYNMGRVVSVGLSLKP